MPRPWKAYGRYGSVGIELVLSILIGYYAGNWADARWLGGHGWGSLAGFLVGAYAGFRTLYRAAKLMQRDVEREEQQDPEAHKWKKDESWVHDGRLAPKEDGEKARGEEKKDE